MKDIKSQNTVKQLNAYEQRQADRIERYRDNAERARDNSRAAHTRAHSMADMIPFGQPILVGHHSERRDRNYRAKIQLTFDKAFKLQDKASYYDRKAETVGTGGISSDDPDAVKKLKEKLENLTASQEIMKNANKAIKKNKTPETQLSALVDLGIREDLAKELLKGDFCGRIGFASYALSNNNAEIRRLTKRIEDLEKIKTVEDVCEEYEIDKCKYEAFTFKRDNEENRVMFIFNGKPSEEVREVLKSNGFRWSPTRGAWVRKITGNALASARWVKEQLLA